MQHPLYAHSKVRQAEHRAFALAAQVCNKGKDSTQGRNYSEIIYSENSKTLVGKVADDVAVAMENSRALKQMQERRLGMQDHRATASKMDTLRNLTYDIRDSLGCENAKVTSYLIQACSQLPWSAASDDPRMSLS